MNKSEKINIIKKITKRLKNEDWGIIDLTLEQFDFPTTDSWSNDRPAYVLEHIKNGKESNLSALASHLDIIVDSKEKETEINPSFWKDGYTRLFISHINAGKETARELKDNLEKYAISGFVAHSDIAPTKEWQDEIEIALKTCDSLIALMIEGFHESKWTDQEIGVALGRDTLIMSVKMGQDPYGFIGKFQALPFVDVETLAKDIFESLTKNKKTSKKTAYSMMYRFENSNSFGEAKSNFQLIRRIEFWDDKLISKLKQSVNNNSQISGTYHLPGMINNLLRTVDK